MTAINSPNFDIFCINIFNNSRTSFQLIIHSNSYQGKRSQSNKKYTREYMQSFYEHKKILPEIWDLFTDFFFTHKKMYLYNWTYKIKCIILSSLCVKKSGKNLKLQRVFLWYLKNISCILLRATFFGSG